MNSRQKMKPHIGMLIIAALLLVLPLIVPNAYVISIMVLVAIFGVLALGIGVLFVYAGLFTLVQPVFLGLGAYTAAILSLRGVPPVISILAGGFLVAIVALMIGAPVLRLRGFALILSSFAILLASNIAFTQLEITGAANGLQDIPLLSLGSLTVKGDVQYYYLSWAFCVACLLICTNIINSRPGRAIQAARDSETGAASLGVNVAVYQLEVFVITSVMAGFAGGIYCFYLRVVSPALYSYDLLISLVLMTIVGGIGRVWAPLLGCFVIMWLDELMKAYLGRILPVMTGNVTNILFGIIIIVLMIFAPSGLVGLLDEAKRYFRRVFRSGESA
jgi:branched-chain amino acid transport system permease protein